MSAWVVSKGHIDCLVQAMAMEGLIEFRDADHVGQALWCENHRSVNYRYSEDTVTPTYSFRGVEAPLDAGIVLKQTACYEYQSCEHPEWKRSNAFALIEALEVRLLASLGLTREEFYETAAWERAPWGIESIEEAIVSRVR